MKNHVLFINGKFRKYFHEYQFHRQIDHKSVFNKRINFSA